MQTITIQKNKLPEGWEVKRLDEIADFSHGYGIKRKELVEEGIPVYGSNGVIGYTKKACFEGEGIAIGRVGACGEVHLLPIKAWISDNAIIVKPKKDKIILKFLFYLLKSIDFSKIISGTSQPLITQTKIKNLDVSIPPLKTQQKIVQKLDAFFESYNKLKQEKQKAKEKYEQILQSAITSLIPQKELPEGWGEKELKEVTEIIMGQSPPSKTYNSDGKGLPFFQGKAEFGERYPIPKKWCTEPKKKAEKDDILMSVRAPVGPVNISNQKCCIGRGLCSIRARKKLTHLFLYYFLKNQEFILSEKGQGSTFNAISKKDVEKIIIPVPSLEEQKIIVKKLEKIHVSYLEIIEQGQSNIHVQLSQLPKAVLSKAFKGELI